MNNITTSRVTMKVEGGLRALVQARGIFHLPAGRQGMENIRTPATFIVMR